MSEETKNTAQEEETTETPVTEETVENEPEVVENGEAETEEIPVEDGDEEASQDDKKDSKSKTSFFGKKKKEKDKFEQQIEELTDRLKRNMAEFDNFRKRTEKEKSSMYIIGAKDIVEKMLPVVDNFERGLAQAPEGDSFADGMKMIYKQLITDGPAHRGHGEAAGLSGGELLLPYRRPGRYVSELSDRGRRRDQCGRWPGGGLLGQSIL